MYKNGFLRNDVGNVIVEYSLVASMFFLVVIGIFEIAALFFVQASLEVAINESSRFGRTGDVMPGQTQENTVREIINRLTYGTLDQSHIHLRITPVADFTSASISEVNLSSIDFGRAGQPMVYTVTYDWPMVTQLIMSALGSEEIYRLTASTIVMNEPFPEDD